MESICILGAGLYGSYLANALAEKFDQAQILLIDTGNSTTKTEGEAGFLSFIRQELYTSIKEGRFFGLGGTSARWAGQLLFFSEHDCLNDERVDEIRKANIDYKDRVLKRFFKKAPYLEDYEIEKGIFFKQGIWLKYSQRNFFKFFNIKLNKNIKVLNDTRIIKLNITGKQLSGITIKNQSTIKTIEADRFYLTCGAFESMRLLGVSGIYDLEKITSGFCDRVSIKGFTIQETKAKILDVDLSQKIIKNSLLVSRIIGEVGGSSFYVKPIFNNDFAFIRQLKNLITKKNPFSLKLFLKGIKETRHIILFLYHYYIYKRLYIYKGWDIFIDMEIGQNSNKFMLSDETDLYGEAGLNIFFKIPSSTIDKLKEAKRVVREILIKSKISFQEMDNNESISDIKETLHPYNLYNSLEKSNLKNVYNPLENLFVYHTGTLSRLGGNNPTASLLCLIEKHVAEMN
jgi:hypothetical protein